LNRRVPIPEYYPVKIKGQLVQLEGENEMKILFAVLLVVHGFIVAAQSSGSFHPSAGVKNPSWLTWWPVNLGQSWLLSPSGLEQTLIARAGGLLWLAAGIALAAAGLGVFGILVPPGWWRSLALAGAIISLGMLALYLHPFYGIGLGASTILLIALVWGQSPLLDQLGL
jgi:hypothetical protein